MNLSDTVTIVTTVQDLLLYAIPVILFIIMIYQIGYLVGLKYVHSAIKRVIPTEGSNSPDSPPQK